MGGWSRARPPLRGGVQRWGLGLGSSAKTQASGIVLGNAFRRPDPPSVGPMPPWVGGPPQGLIWGEDIFFGKIGELPRCSPPKVTWVVVWFCLASVSVLFP